VSAPRGWRCSRCGQWHDELPTAYGADAPAQWYAIPPGERDARAVLSSDQCVIDDRFFFVLGQVEIPIVDGGGESFAWGVWVSLGEQSFERMAALWETPGREAEPPCFGWLSTSLPGYPDTLNLKTRVHTRPAGVRPSVELEPTGHPLAVEQRDGITRERVRRIAETVLHPERG
jgi:hypothetical protein